MVRHYLFLASLISIITGITLAQLLMPPQEDDVRQALDEAIEKRIPAKLNARISAFPEMHPAYQRLVLTIDNDVTLTARTSRGFLFSYGDTVTLQGNIREVPDFLKEKGIQYETIMPQVTRFGETTSLSLWRLLSFIRSRATRTLNNIFPEPQSAYAAALLIGDRSGISYELNKTFQRAGTSHIVALSGFNITLIVTFLTILFTHVGIDRRNSFWPIMAGIVFFVLITGASASVVRAGIMGAVVALGYRTGRQYHLVNALLLAAALMLLIDPTLARGDIGFQLSFAATIGMVTVGQYLIERCKNVPNPLGVRDMLCISLGVEVVVLPLLMYHFGQVAMLSIIVNLLILPLVPPLTIVGYGILALGFLFVSLAKIVAFPVSLLFSYQLAVMHFFADIPFAVMYFPPISLATLLVLYTCMAGALFYVIRYASQP